MHSKDAEGIANSVDPDQTAPLGVGWSGSALFAQTCLSENFGALLYLLSSIWIQLPNADRIMETYLFGWFLYRKF